MKTQIELISFVPSHTRIKFVIFQGACDRNDLFYFHAFIAVGSLRFFDATLIGKYIFMNKLNRDRSQSMEEQRGEAREVC